MSKFEVGDRVRLIAKSKPPTTSAQIHVGEELTFHQLTNQGNALVEHDETGTWCVNTDDLELISKGESSMDGLEAIAVTGDKDLREKLIEIAEEHGFNGCQVGEVYNVFYLDCPRTSHPQKSVLFQHSHQPEESDSNTFSRVPKSKRAILDLPQDWEQAKKFVTQEVDKPLTIGAYEAEIKEDKVKVGCQTFSYEEVLAVRDFLRAAQDNEAPDLSFSEWEEIGEEILERMEKC